MIQDLKIIKKHYGEKMMHLCRELFPTLLEEEGYLSKLILDNFAPSRFLYDDIIENNYIERFKNYIYEIVDLKIEDELKTNKPPKELLSEAGYNLYECKTEDEIQKFKKYYAPGEELCTFNGGRLNGCYVFFAVKKNVDEIKRENFKIPQRQDEYGTSVISIQFGRGNVNTLSIKNRYNHRVSNPDATFSNNLENIIEGLTNSFETEYNLKINQNDKGAFELPNYVNANDGKFYKYNYEINNIYYCPNNIIIDHFEAKQYPKERFIILDYFILDLKEKYIFSYEYPKQDSFDSSINNISNLITKINLIKTDKDGHTKIEIETENQKHHGINNITIEIDKYNRIIGYKNKNITEIHTDFLYNNKTLTWLELPNVKKIDHFVLKNNKLLKYINLPKVEIIGSDFLYYNEEIISVYLPNVRGIGNNFLYKNENLRYLNLPLVKYIGENFLISNQCLVVLEANQLRKTGRNFLLYNEELRFLNLPKLKKTSVGFLSSNKKIKYVYLPNLESVFYNFLSSNKEIDILYLPKLIELDYRFLQHNNKLEKMYVPKIECLDVVEIPFNPNEIKLYAPLLEECDRDSIVFNYKMIETLPDSEIELYESQIKKAQVAQDKLKVKIQKAIDKELNVDVKVKKK